MSLLFSGSAFQVGFCSRRLTWLSDEEKAAATGPRSSAFWACFHSDGESRPASGVVRKPLVPAGAGQPIRDCAEVAGRPARSAGLRSLRAPIRFHGLPLRAKGRHQPGAAGQDHGPHTSQRSPSVSAAASRSTRPSRRQPAKASNSARAMMASKRPSFLKRTRAQPSSRHPVSSGAPGRR